MNLGSMLMLILFMGSMVNAVTTETTQPTGNYGQPCINRSLQNASCNAPFKCVRDTCSCDVSYNWDAEKKTCKKLCLGSAAGLVRTGSFHERYEMYKQKYTNCAYVEGDLEITFLEGDYDLRFLKNIEEVTGYVLIASVWSNYVPLNNLRIIRGRTLYKYKDVDYALYVALNYNPNNSTQGIFELGFKSLTEITRGKVYFFNNNRLCFEPSIRWQDINPNEPNQLVVFKSDSIYERRLCGECHDTCYNEITREKHCWGMGPDMCQNLNYGDVCSLTCESRCFGSGQHQCCHPECAAGCHGPRASDCYACKTFYNDGMCVKNCGAEYLYDHEKKIFIKNVYPKYMYTSLCVTECPEHLLRDQGFCVVECPDKKEPDVHNRVCVDCHGPCKKICVGTDGTDYVNQKNIQSFKDCTTIQGNLRILKMTFSGDPFRNISEISVNDLHVLNTVKEITGYLAIQQIPRGLRNLSFLSNLEIIHGRSLSSGRFSVSLASMNITELGLKSLKHIKNGDAIIASVPRLCYLENINLTGIFSTLKQQLFKANNKDPRVCRAEGKVCDPECSQHGCWGPGPFNCLKCAYHRVSHNNQCVHSCSDQPLLYEDGGTCKQCDVQCADSCTGPGPANCTRCNHVSLPVIYDVSSVCVEKCSDLQMSGMHFYRDDHNVCRPCNDTCADGCTGPSNEVGYGGCNTCEIAINNTITNMTISCLPQDQDWCPQGYYMMRLQSLPVTPLSRKLICQPCHDLCRECTGPSTENCKECRFFKYRSLCVSVCPNYTFTEYATKSCHQCDNQCAEGCVGPSAMDCRECTNYKIMHSNDSVTFKCVDKCPPQQPFLVPIGDRKNGALIVCADETHPWVLNRLSVYKELLCK